MSGTSLDGLDIVACSFQKNSGGFFYKTYAADTVVYDNNLKKRLADGHLSSAEELLKSDIDFGIFIGNSVLNFIKKHRLNNIFLIASHGHTIFHQPKNGFTFQIGNGATISKTTNISVVCDFRSGDVALNGQGAPLVPIGDEFLFGNYDACLNLGGFSNISYKYKNKRIAYDICPVNIILNKFANYFQKQYDEGGKIAETGKFIPELYEKLNKINFYNLKNPKSLSREWLENVFMPVLDFYKNKPKADIMFTLIKHIAYQISLALKGKKNVLITGGGAFNNFLINSLKEVSKTEIIIPDKDLVMYKEAIVFAFLGYLRWNGEINCLSSVTGADRDSCCGAVYL